MRLPCAAILIFLLTCGSGWTDWNVIMHENRRHVPVEDVARFYGLQLSAGAGKNFRMVGRGRTLEGQAGQREVLIDGVKYILCFPIVSRNNRTLLSAMDVTKIIEPVLRPGKIENATQVRTVILDPGHGGHDSGAVGLLGREKDYALDVAKRAKALLEQRGYQVLMTRSTDVFVPLEKRSAFANRHKNAIFISIHFNASKTGTGTGIETFCLAPRGVPSMDEETVTVNAVRQYPGHARDPENILLATAIHSSLLRYCPLPDRGIKRARFHVIRETKIPSVLIEGGFLDSSRDARMVHTPAYRQRMAMAILEGVVRFQGAVRGRPFLPAPSLVASGADPTGAPTLRKKEPEEKTAQPGSEVVQAKVKTEVPEEGGEAKEKDKTKSGEAPSQKEDESKPEAADSEKQGATP